VDAEWAMREGGDVTRRRREAVDRQMVQISEKE
jgi:hypothetical protein